MKKLTTLLFVLVFASSMAFAQNDATVNQNGNSNDVVVDQVYSSGASSAINEAMVDQDGDNNSVERLNQVGAGNWFGVTQNGNGNLVRSHAEQGESGAASYDGTISITQNNNDNEVWDADQAGSNNSATVTQNGNDVANIEAQVSPNGSSGNTINISQTSGSNSVGSASANGSGAYQEGVGNSMDINQSGGASAGTVDKLVSGVNGSFYRGSAEGGQSLVQFGDDNTMTIDQTGASTVEFVVQDGSLNNATITQTGMGHTADVMQIGSSNTSTITQN